jgi:hypothetical protein
MSAVPRVIHITHLDYAHTVLLPRSICERGKFFPRLFFSSRSGPVDDDTFTMY